MRVNIVNDAYMEYDSVLHRYVLTPAGAKLAGIDVIVLYGLQEGNFELKRQSNQVYGWLYSKVSPGNHRNVEFLIATGGEFRDAMFEALLGQAEYAKVSGGNDTSLYTGISLSKGNAIPLDVLRGDVTVSQRSINALTSVGLLYSGAYRWNVPKSMYRVGY